MIRPSRALGALGAAVLAACGGGASTPQPSGPTPTPTPTPAPPRLVANGAVRAIAVAPDGTAYLGGDFTAVGPFTGNLVVLDSATGALAVQAPGFSGSSPHPGSISAATADGRGGWYVGGWFRTAAGAGEVSLAHLRADGTLDPAFATSFDGPVRALAVGDGVVYVGGGFDQVGGAWRHRLAAVDAATGAVTGWDPMSDPSWTGESTGPSPRTVNALALGSGTIYAAGAAWLSSGWLAAIDPAGAVSAWHPRIDRDVQALAVRAGILYVGGQFTTVEGEPRTGLAAFDARGALSPWSVEARDVGALAVVDGVLYAGGPFTTVGGRPHPGIVAFDPSGAPSSWDPGLDGHASAFAGSGGTLYVGGVFDRVGGARRLNLAAFDASGALLPWDPAANGEVLALCAASGRVLAGGTFTSAGSAWRSRLAALDAEGRLTAWNPDVDLAGGSATVRALAFAGDRLYVGGVFDTVGGTPRANLAAVDLLGGVVAGTPSVSGTVHTLAVVGGAVYVGGEFSAVGGVPRTALAAFDPGANGSVLPFDPGLTRSPGSTPIVYALAARGSTLYAGGRFARAADAVRGNGAAFDAGGALLPWDPAADGPSALWNVGIEALAPTDQGVYVGGRFWSLGGSPRNAIGRVDATTGAADGWDPAAATSRVDTAHAILAAGDVYVGGVFVQRGGSPPRSATALDAVTGATTGWSPGDSYYVYALGRSGGRLLIGDATGVAAVPP